VPTLLLSERNYGNAMFSLLSITLENFVVKYLNIVVTYLVWCYVVFLLSSTWRVNELFTRSHFVVYVTDIRVLMVSNLPHVIELLCICRLYSRRPGVGR